MHCDVLIFTDTNGVRGISRDAGTYRIASELRENGFNVQVIDFYSRSTPAQRNAIIKKFIGPQTLFVGFSTTHVTSLSNDPIDVRRRHREKILFPFPEEIMLDWIADMRSANPLIKIVLGGYKTSLQEEYPAWIDHVFVGESDRSIVNFARELSEGKVDRELSIYPDGNDRFGGFSGSRYFWSDADLLFEGEHLPLETARGCIFSCKFCNYAKKKRGELVKSASRLEDELKRNYELFGTTGYFFSDPLFNDSIDKVRDFHSVVSRLPFKIEWASFARIEQFARYPEMRELFLESGARSIQFGIETMNPRSGTAIGKCGDPSKIVELLHFLRESWKDKVMMGSGFIIGLPHETVDSAYRLFEWLIADDCPLDSFIFSELRIEHFESLLSRRSRYIDYSDISRHPERFGYSVAQGGYWKNENMDLNMALELLLQFTRSPQALGKRKAGDYVIYNRLRTVGFSIEECFSTVLSDKETLSRGEAKKAAMIGDYFERICH